MAVELCERAGLRIERACRYEVPFWCAAAVDVDVLIVVSTERLLQIAPPGISLTDSFALADEVLRQGIVGLTDLVTKTGLVNVDFADFLRRESTRAYFMMNPEFI